MKNACSRSAGVHALEASDPCQLAQVEPATALEDLHWKNALVVRARSEGRAELTCGKTHARLRVVAPARLDLVLVDDHVAVGHRFQVRAVPRDRDGHELEIGKWTELTWHADGQVTPDNRSLGRRVRPVRRLLRRPWLPRHPPRAPRRSTRGSAMPPAA